MLSQLRKATGQVFEDLIQLVGRSRQQSHVFLERYGVTVPQSGVLRVLCKSRAMPIGALAEALYLKTSTVSGIIDRLERDGFVTRLRGSADRRVVRVSLTEKGEQLAENLPGTSFDRVRRAIERLEEDEVKMLMKVMSRLLQLVHEEEKADLDGKA